ncbi:MAG: type 4a pilus biogenesis protein PilO [Candidatus Hydrogenedens sp.]|nr:type 4a pilus biogenesis protein PilO [Candidatus Hydrogenedens sp.]
MSMFAKGKITRHDWAFVGIVLGVTALLFVAFYFFGFSKLKNEIKAGEAELAKVTKELKDAHDLTDGIEELRLEAQEMNHLVDTFEDRLPEERQIPALLARFEKLGNEMGLRVQLSSMPTRKTLNSDMEVIPYKAITDGQFHQIVSFINMLERDERYLKISDLDVEEEVEGISKATFVLSTFRFLNEPEIVQ